MIQRHTSTLLIYLTHIASQLLYKYLPVPLPKETQESLATATWMGYALAMDAEDWHLCALHWGHWYGSAALGSGMDAFWDHASFLDPLAIAAQRHLQQVYQGNAKIILRGSSGYPPLLSCIEDAPWALSYWGEEEVFLGEAISLVGARQATAFSMEESFTLGLQAADCGYVVVSGGAFGCDISSHRGVLQSEASPCPAIVVMASGLSSLYPRAHGPWYREIILRGGIVMTERLWWAQCRPYDFLVRNRLIAGLSKVTCIIQAASRSGAMTTARLALDQGRDVFVLSPDKEDARTEGNRGLIEQGATEFSRAVCLFSEGLLH